MKFQKLVLLLALFTLITSNIYAQDINKEVEAIKDVIQSAYVEGLQNEGDMEKIDRGFHPDFNLLGIGKDNEMWKYPIAKWKESVAKKVEEGKIPKTDKDKVTVKFLNVDVTGIAASVKLEFYIGPKLAYVDYISLYKFDEDWKIVNKIFHKF